MTTNIMTVIHYPVFGGPHNQTVRLEASLRNRGWRNLVVLPNEAGNAVARLAQAGLEVKTIPLHRLRALHNPFVHASYVVGLSSEVNQLRGLIREHEIHLVQVTGLVNPHAAVAARLEGLPVVWQLLDTRAPRILRKGLSPLVTRLADVVMTTGTRVGHLHPPVPRLGWRWMPYLPPVDIGQCRIDSQDRRQARERLQLRDDGPVIGTVGNLNPQKGHEFLLEAAALVAQSIPNVSIRILGASTPTQVSYHKDLHRRARDLGLHSDHLLILDPGDRVTELLPGFDVFVLPSVPRSEGIPTVIGEAMACSVPVVATDVGGVREVVRHNVTGLVVPPLDASAIATAITTILQDPAQSERMQAAARALATERFSVEACVDTHIRAFNNARSYRRTRSLDWRPMPKHIQPSMESDELRRLLACPACKGELQWSTTDASCFECQRCYPIVDGIPIMLVHQDEADHDELDHSSEHDHRQHQAKYYDRDVAAEFEITRPHGAPAIHRWLLEEKFRRSVSGIEGRLPGATALTVCGGSGMDGEFLTRVGTRVVVSDISLGAAQRARARAERFGIPLMPIVAAAEQLPFRAQSIGLVYVHDGLHHLADPLAGIKEMARVASSAISITEPAAATATALATKVGLALEYEGPGNRIVRFKPETLKTALRCYGLTIIATERYAMYYKHAPGPLSQLFSLSGTWPTSSAWRLANGLLGRFGNKLSVRAVRDKDSTTESKQDAHEYRTVDVQ
jgi:glycosyltransferase involved in cell wall biosynthesis/uncharacterized protein YbaR (Trm112 family)